METKAFEFRGRVKLAFHQLIQRSFVVISTNMDADDANLESTLEKSRQHRAILRELIAELNDIAEHYGENFEGSVFGNLVVNDELDKLAILDGDLKTIHDSWYLLEAVTFSSSRTLSVHFAAYLQVQCLQTSC